MGKKQKAAEAGTEKSSKAKLAGMAVAMVAIGAVVGPKITGGGAAAAPATDTTTTTVEGPIVVLDKVTLNLSDGHLLQVGLALELSSDAGGGGGHGEAADTEDPTKGFAKAIDATIEILGNETVPDLSAPGGRDRAKHALEQELHELYHGEVVGVYFHQFVMQ